MFLTRWCDTTTHVCHVWGNWPQSLCMLNQKCPEALGDFDFFRKLPIHHVNQCCHHKCKQASWNLTAVFSPIHGKGLQNGNWLEQSVREMQTPTYRSPLRSLLRLPFLSQLKIFLGRSSCICFPWNQSFFIDQDKKLLNVLKYDHMNYSKELQFGHVWTSLDFIPMDWQNGWVKFASGFLQGESDEETCLQKLIEDSKRCPEEIIWALACAKAADGRIAMQVFTQSPRQAFQGHLLFLKRYGIANAKGNVVHKSATYGRSEGLKIGWI